jgi:hypothetical protein
MGAHAMATTQQLLSMCMNLGCFHSSHAKLFLGLPRMISSPPKEQRALGFGTKQSQRKSTLKWQQKVTKLVLAHPFSISND